MTRTRANKVAVAAWLGLIASVAIGTLTIGTLATAYAVDKANVIIPQNSVFVLSWMGGKSAGIFKKHDIDISVDARPFAAFLAGLPSKETMATTYSGMEAIEKMNQGVDWTIIGGGLTVFHRIFVKKDSPIKTPADLRGKRIGVWSTGAGAFKAVRTALIDAHGIDIVKDTKVVQLAPPALLKLLERGEVDAMVNISSFTINAASQPDKFRSIFNPNEHWIKKTGYPIVFTAPLIAWTSWIKENPKRAKNLAAAAMESMRWLRNPENFDAAVKQHGTLAGVKTPEAIALYKKWLSEKQLFLTEWDQKAVDSQWQFLELAKRTGVLDKVPPKEKHALTLSK